MTRSVLTNQSRFAEASAAEKVLVTDATNSTDYKDAEASIVTAGGVSVQKDIHCNNLFMNNGIKSVWVQYYFATNSTNLQGAVDWTELAQSEHERFSLSTSRLFINVSVPGGIYRVTGNFIMGLAGDERLCGVEYLDNDVSKFQSKTFVQLTDGTTTYSNCTLDFIYQLNANLDTNRFIWYSLSGANAMLFGFATGADNYRTVLNIIQVG